MSVGPSDTGYNGQIVRPETQNQRDKIDLLLSDPIYVEKNNRASAEDKANGAQKFIFQFEGQLNDLELSSIETDYTGAGWDTVTCVNNGINPRDAIDYRTWTLLLESAPTPPST